jgi:trimeric autotransporter adhesin
VCPETSDTLILTKTKTSFVPEAGADQVLETSETRLNGTLPENGTGKWTIVMGGAEISDPNSPATTISKLSVGNNIVRWTVSISECAKNSDDIVLFVSPLKIPNGFSPNGDGINDQFVINALDYYRSPRLSVFNRWGDLLYENFDYKNDWDGSNSKGEQLVDDTYYYILEIPELKTYTGFVIIKRTR